MNDQSLHIIPGLLFGLVAVLLLTAINRASSKKESSKRFGKLANSYNGDIITLKEKYCAVKYLRVNYIGTRRKFNRCSLFVTTTFIAVEGLRGIEDLTTAAVFVIIKGEVPDVAAQGYGEEETLLSAEFNEACTEVTMVYRSIHINNIVQQLTIYNLTPEEYNALHHITAWV